MVALYRIIFFVCSLTWCSAVRPSSFATSGLTPDSRRRRTTTIINYKKKSKLVFLRDSK